MDKNQLTYGEGQHEAPLMIVFLDVVGSFQEGRPQDAQWEEERHGDAEEHTRPQAEEE